MDKLAMLRTIRSEVWAMRPDAIEAYVAYVLTVEPEEKPPRVPKVEGSIAIVPIHGTIGHRRSSGYPADTYSEDVTRYLGDVAANASVGGVVLDIDSPGGTVSGLSEVSDAVASLKASKPVYAVANPEAASAAYHIGSQATKFYSTPSGEVGSIGVWAAHQDISGMLEKVGVKFSLISAGKYKVEGNPFEPLGDEAREEIQRSVDLHYDRFIGAVSAGRGVPKSVVREKFGQGRMIEADRAKELGMIDGIATLNDVILGMAKSTRPNRLRQASISIGLTESAIRR